MGSGSFWFWLPGFKDGYKSTIGGIVMGQPDGLRWWFDFWIRVQQNNATFFWGLIAVETLIALALLFGFARKATPAAAPGMAGLTGGKFHTPLFRTHAWLRLTAPLATPPSA